jgi:hypothetical protein
VNPWDGSRRASQTGFGCNSEDTYLFSFVMWSEVADSFYIDFEDPANDYLRYGSTSSEWSPGGTSEWWIITEQEPTKYVIDDLIFGNKVENTSENFNLMGGGHNNGGVFFDSLILINSNDLSMIAAPYTEVESVTVSGEGGATAVPAGGTLQMAAEVLPADADYSDVVYWSVLPGTGDATIDDDGILTGDTVGTVTVIASASDDSQVVGTLQVSVSWPEGIQQNAVNTLRVYPNPAVNELNVVLTRENSTVAIYNSVGMKMEEVTVTGTEHRFNISGYASGIYFVKTEDSVAKFIK